MRLHRGAQQCISSERDTLLGRLRWNGGERNVEIGLVGHTRHYLAFYCRGGLDARKSAVKAADLTRTRNRSRSFKASKGRRARSERTYIGVSFYGAEA